MLLCLDIFIYFLSSLLSNYLFLRVHYHKTTMKDKDIGLFNQTEKLSNNEDVLIFVLKNKETSYSYSENEIINQIISASVHFN